MPSGGFSFRIAPPPGADEADEFQRFAYSEKREGGREGDEGGKPAAAKLD
jgi:hypothetical protein